MMTMSKSCIVRRCVVAAIISPLVLCVASPVAFAAPALDGTKDAAYGGPLAVQSVNTNFADNQDELDAGYAYVQSGVLYLMITGQVRNNFNKLELFFDTKTGGQNVLDTSASFGGTNPENDQWALKHAGMTFDTGFEADYLVSVTNGTSGDDQFNAFYAVIGGGLGNYVQANHIFGSSLTGSNASALSNGIGIAYDNSNIAGIVGGTGAANPVAAMAVTTGLELAIPLSTLGNPSGPIKISAMINGANFDYLSNQFLAGLPAGTGNLGGDGGGGFTGSLSGIDLNQFAGNQYFTLRVVPEPTSVILLGIGSAALLHRRRDNA